MKNENYLYIWDYVNENYPFQIFIGGRGTGKTYSALDGAINGQLQDNAKFILMRRTGQELELLFDGVNGEGVNPFKSINMDSEKNVGMKKIVKNLGGIYNREFDSEKQTLNHIGRPLGFGVALSTIASIRGVDFSDVTDIFYDEFIPENHVKKIKNEGEALLNAYETINRNREFRDLPPCRLWLLANSNNIYNAIFITLGIVTDVEKMTRKGKSDLYFNDRGLAVHIVKNSVDFVEKKKNTALYKLSKNTAFYNMALNNQFAYNDFSQIKSIDTKGYKPICAIRDMDKTFYILHRNNTIYATYYRADTIVFDLSKTHELEQFVRQFAIQLNNTFINGKMFFESYEIKAKILELVN